MPVVSQRLGMFAAIILYLFAAISFATQTPAWQAPDEPAHYNYIAQVASAPCCPIIQAGDWDQAYLEEVKSARFHPDILGRLETVRYENHQPPLYYLFGALVYRLFNGELIALRLYSVLWGAVVVGAAYEIAFRLFDRRWTAFGAAALVGLIPQHLSILASVNNDAMAEAVVAITLLLTMRWLKGEAIPVWQLGLWVGIGFLTKASTYFMVGVVVYALWQRWRSNRATYLLSPEAIRPVTLPDGKRAIQTRSVYRPLIGALAAFLIPALLLGGIWWLRNISTYGFPDFLGLRAHDAVVVGQPRTEEWIAERGFGGYLNVGLQTTFQSFWGQFGWMALPLENRFTLIFAGLFVLGLSGLLVDSPQRARAAKLPDALARLQIRRTFALALILSLLAFVYYNTEFVQFQGRYLYPGLIVLAVMLITGLEAWRRMALRGRWEWLWGVFALALFALDLYLLTRVIVPGLSPL